MIDRTEFASVFSRAVVFAMDRHAGQFRKCAKGVPFVIHPLRVCERLRSEAVPPVHHPVALLAAILHDTVEDTPTRLEEIADLFGAEVAAVVGELTNDQSLPKPERKAEMIARLGRASLLARVVKLADRLDNLQDMPDEWSASKRQSYLVESDRLVNAIMAAPPTGDADLLQSLADLAGRVRHQQVAMGFSPEPGTD